MNQAKIMRLNGASPTGEGVVEWEDSGSTTTDDITLVGGNYLLLCSIALTLANLDDDLFWAEWSNAELRPPRYEYHTREHTHSTGGTGPIGSGDLSLGPRLIYQNPLQWWAGGLLEAGTIQLELSHAADIVLIAVRTSHISNADSLGMTLE